MRGVANDYSRRQLERLYGAFNLAAKAMGKTTKEMNKALELGQITAKEMIPKLIPLMNQLADKNGALATQLDTAQTAQNRFNLVAQEGADTIFQGGMEEGLKEFYKTLSELLKDAGPQLKKIGHAFGVFFKGLSHAIKMIEPFLKILIDNMGLLFGGAMIMKIGALGKAITLFATGAKISLASAFWPITLALAALEEMASLMSDKLVGTLESSLGMQINLKDGTTTGLTRGEDGGYYSEGGSESNYFAGLIKNLPAFRIMGGVSDYLSRGSSTTSSSSTTVTNNNTFQVSNRKEFEDIQNSQYAAAMGPQTR